MNAETSFLLPTYVCMYLKNFIQNFVYLFKKLWSGRLLLISKLLELVGFGNYRL